MPQGRIALVTGASRGIGHAIATELASRGYALALTARSASDLERLAATLRRGGREVMTVAADLRSPTSPRAITRAVAEQLGAIDLLVNVAGTAPAGKFENISDDELESALDLHVKAPFRLIREVLPSMKERGSGCLIQLASTAGLRGYPLVAAYAAAKHGMIGMTRALAAELARTPIRVHAVCPGFVDTDITRQAAAAIAARGSKTESEILQSYAAMNACGRLLLPAEVAVTVADAADGEPPPPSGRIFVLDDMPPTYLT